MKVRLLEIKNLSISYSNTTVLSQVSFEIEEGEWVLIQGFNGEGKTTLIKALLNLIPYSGNILLNGKELKEYSIYELEQMYSYLPQRLDSIPNISVSDFLSLYPSNKESVVNRLSINSLLPLSLQSLSLGQLQLVLFAQSLLKNTCILILDEPFTFIDSEYKERIYGIIKELSIQGKTIILVSHEVERRYLPDKIITLSNCKTYNSPVLVKQRINKELTELKKIKTKYIYSFFILSLILFICIPSDTPILLRFIWCVLSGGSFSFLGAILQKIYKNSIVTPNTLGFTSFSILGSFLSTTLSFSFIFLDSLLALICTTIGCLPTLFIKNKQGYGLFCTTAIFLFLIYYSKYNPSILHFLLYGNNIVSYYSLFLIPLIIVPLFILYSLSDKITLLNIDSNIAKIFGISYTKNLTLVTVLLALIISILVSHTGPIYFISLLIPNLIFYKYGDSLKQNLNPIFFIGSSFTLCVDSLIRLFSLLI